MNQSALKSMAIFLLFCSNNLLAQISGTVTGANGVTIPGISVVIEGTTIGSATDSNGKFQIDVTKPETLQLRFSGVGYEKQTVEVSLATGQHKSLQITMEENTVSMDGIVIEGQSEAEILRLKGYAVEVLESKQLKNFNNDINQMLKTTSGIHIRESGGLGSGFKLSLNGLSGNQIRYFMDGIPMENFGSSLSLNNFQVNLIDKLEVYKGVVPISLGADALGGAINLVTDYRQKSFLDASYSYGSFNTHRAAINGQYANQNNKYFAKLSAFINHSDNNYEMDNVPVYDLELGNNLGTINTKRFHDQYTSSMLFAETGLFDRNLADKLAVSVTVAQNKKNHQTPDNNIKRVFGQFNSANNTLLISANYRKQIDNLHIKAYILTGKIKETVSDTSDHKYNWAQDYIIRPDDDPKGELFERRSQLELTDNVAKSQLGMEYDFSNNHGFSANFTQNYLSRTGEDKVDIYNRSYESPNYIHKNLLGIAYNFKNILETVDVTLFGKNYWYFGKIISQDEENNDITTKPSLNKTGFGTALSYQINSGLFLKTSFENAYRIPESFEILGDGIYVNPNPDLQPEQSNNFNLGSRYKTQRHDYTFTTEVNYFYRYSTDFIRFNPLGPFGEYENLKDVKTSGLEGSLDISYRKLLSFNTNITYQNLTDRTETDEGLPNANYKSRIPNVPYFFLNARLGVSPSKASAKNKVQFYLNTRYIHDFFLTWENLGNADGKNVIPSQLTHDFQAEYAMNGGKYNFSMTISNLTNKLVYDNFNIQKPGRALYFKIRYFIH